MKSKRSYLTTAQVAAQVGVHPNTVRLYEQWGFLPPIPRTPAGYRKFTPFHVDLMKLARLALCFPYPGGKGPVIELVQRAGRRDLGGAMENAYLYLANIRAEIAQAEASIEFLERWAGGALQDATPKSLRIGEVCTLLGVGRDALRNWERNGLIEVPRQSGNGYRMYSRAEIGRLRVIRSLRQAGYSIMALLRMLTQFDRGGAQTDLRHALETPGENEDIYTAADQWLTTLNRQQQRALDVIALLEEMIEKEKGGPGVAELLQGHGLR